jgi:hypothetical protein
MVPATDGAGAARLKRPGVSYTDAGQSRGARSEDVTVDGADAVLCTAAHGTTLVGTVGTVGTRSYARTARHLDAAATSPCSSR